MFCFSDCTYFCFNKLFMNNKTFCKILEKLNLKNEIFNGIWYLIAGHFISRRSLCKFFIVVLVTLEVRTLII